MKLTCQPPPWRTGAQSAALLGLAPGRPRAVGHLQSTKKTDNAVVRELLEKARGGTAVTCGLNGDGLLSSYPNEPVTKT
jgi:hypothetical protein